MNLFSLPLMAASAVGTKTLNMGLMERMTPPEDISVHGHLIDWLFNYTTILNVFFFLLVCLGLFGFSYFYSAKRNKKPYYTYGNKKMHIFVATVIGVAVFVGIDMNITRISNNDFTKVFINWPKAEENPVRVQVMAQQWAWNFRYAGKDGEFNTEDDVLTFNDLRLPTDRKVILQFISKDVIHSFFLPNIRRKVDAMPGRLSRLWFQLTKPGLYDIACAEMCGTYHYRMQAKMRVYTPADYEAWMNEAQEKAIAENEQENPDMYWGWAWTW